jgi:hypothetical protein
MPECPRCHNIDPSLMEVRVERLDATRNGMFGGPADAYQVSVPGLTTIICQRCGASVDGEAGDEDHGEADTPQ